MLCGLKPVQETSVRNVTEEQVFREVEQTDEAGPWYEYYKSKLIE